MLKSVCIQNFELILDILDHVKPRISSLKPPGRLAAYYLENTPLNWYKFKNQVTKKKATKNITNET